MTMIWCCQHTSRSAKLLIRTPNNGAFTMEWIVGGILIIAFIGFLFWFFPAWNVWASRKSGEADLAQAQYEQQIQIAQAQGRYNAAELNKKAAIVEAEAVSAQIKEIGEGLQKHD